jgi:hypothetical protein
MAICPSKGDHDCLTHELSFNQSCEDRETFMRKYIFGIALLLFVWASALAQDTNGIATRFGAVTVSDAGVLLFKGTPVQPRIEAEDGLDLSEPYQMETRMLCSSRILVGLRARLSITSSPSQSPAPN